MMILFKSTDDTYSYLVVAPKSHECFMFTQGKNAVENLSG